MNKAFFSGLVLALLLIFLFTGMVFSVNNPFNDLLPPGDDSSTSTSLPSGKSIIYYLKELNAKIVQIEGGTSDNLFKSTGKTEEEVAKIVSDAKRTVPEAQKAAENTSPVIENTSWDNTAIWSDVLTTNNAAVVFPPVKVDGVTKQLKLIFMPRGSDGIANIDVFVNNKNVKCYQGWGRVLNNWFGTTLVFGWGEGQESCEATVIKNQYVVDITMSTIGNHKKFVIKSPLIPTGCNNRTFSQNATGSDQVLKVTC